MSFLSVQNLRVGFTTMRGHFKAVNGISFEMNEGETLGIVGESGSGKSVTSLALMGLLPSVSLVEADELKFLGKDLTKISESEYRKIRGGDMAMIFQDPMTSLNPCFTVGHQLIEAIRTHQDVSKAAAKKIAIKHLEQVGIPAPTERMNVYPHQMSGGQSQRVMIAMAIACQPKLLIADEPTTALDVTIQAQTLRLLKDLREEKGMSMILITHDIGVVAENTERIVVMYAGQIVESGLTKDVIENPKHPYTEALLGSLPGAHGESEHRSPLPSLPGLVPDLVNRPKGCQMHPRCPYVQDHCRADEPVLEAVGSRKVRCFYPIGGSA